MTAGHDVSGKGSQTPALDPKLCELFEGIRANVQKTKLQEERWYVVAVACIVAGPDPEAA